ncbi:SDR family oxidoreductase [Cupriavidus basilensis]
MWKDESLAGKRVLVTAGADGIGLEITRAFVEAGARVAVCDVAGDSLERVCAELPGVVAVRADVSKESDVEALFQAVDGAFGGLDVLVNNAGVAGPTGGVETLSLAGLGAHARRQHHRPVPVRPRRGAAPAAGCSPSIVNLSSAAGHLGMPGRSAYSASKWAVVGFTKSLALELGADGIRVNTVLPGAVDGPRIRAVIAAKAASLGKPLEEVTRNYTSQAALQRMVTMRDIANMVRFLCSDQAANVHGQEMVVDGLTQALS